MNSRWTPALAFLAGLAPGFFLYMAAPRQVPTPPPAVTLAPAAPTAPGATPPPATSGDKRPSAPRSTTPANLPAANERLLADYSDAVNKLMAAQRTVAETQEQMRDLEARNAAAQQQYQQQSQRQEQELREQLQALQRVLTQTDTSLKARDARLAELENAQQRLQRQGAGDTARLQKLPEIAAELEEIARRRESYLNNVISRYREATDLFRAISLRLDNPRDASSPLNNDLSRIQAAIQSADEDLRQIRALNIQSARVQKDLAKR
jgi:chromosome segregation ATPase